MAGPRRKNSLVLEQVLEKIIDRLKEQGLINENVDTKELAEQTKENLTKALGKDFLPSGEALKNPMVLMKLTLSVIATHKDPVNAPINKIFQMQTPEHLQELKKELQLTPQMLKFMQLCIGEKIKQENDASPEDADRNKFVGLYSADGTLIDKYEDVFAPSSLPGEKIQTAEELLTLTGIAETLKADIENDLFSLESAFTLRPPHC